MKNRHGLIKWFKGLKLCLLCFLFIVTDTECLCSLFVFSIGGSKQNARSLLTPVSDKDFYTLLHGSLHFVLHGSSNNHLFQRF